MEEMKELNKCYPSLLMTTTSSSSSSFARNQNFPSNFSPTISSNNSSATQPRYAFRSGIPPIPPPSPSSTTARSPSSSTGIGNSNGNPFHSRSVSQPPFFSLDSLPPLNLPTAPASNVMQAKDDRLPPIPWSIMIPRAPMDRAGHRRSNSDVPFGVVQYNSVPGTMTPPIPRPVKRVHRIDGQVLESNDCVGVGEHEFVNKNLGENGDDFVNSCMNLDISEAMNSCGTEEKQEDFESSRMSGTWADSSENEAESSPNESYGVAFQEKKRGSNKRTASNDPAPANMTHCRSLSMDSTMHNLYYGSDSPTFSPSPPNSQGQISPGGMFDGSGDLFNPEFGNGEFTSAEIKKIMMNQTLTEMAQTDPKKVKRILANRQSAARSKERKMRYINELEHKVQTLQTEATTLSAQLTMLQRDSTGLSSQNNELTIRLQAMEREAQLKEALNAALVAEVQRLKLASGKNSESQRTNSTDQQT